MSRTTQTLRRCRRGEHRPKLGAWLGTLCCALLALACGGDVESRMVEVRALQDVGKFDASIAELREVLAQSPTLPEANYRMGVALVQTGEPSRAVWPLQKAAESSEYEISAGVLLASTHFVTRNFDEAIRAADHVLAIDPDRQAALRIRANANLSARRLEAAYEDSSRLVGLYPKDYGVRALHATVLAETGRMQEAELEHDLLKQMGQESSDPVFQIRACLAPAVFAFERLKNTERAKELYEDCASRKPTDMVVINHLVGFFDRIGETERATRLWRDAVETAPDKLVLRGGLAARLQAQEQSDEAEKVLLDAVDSFESADAWSLLASFYRVHNEPEKALPAIEKVVELSGDDDQRARFIQIDTLIDLGKIERAQELTDALTQPTYAQLLRGRILLAKGNPRAALDEFESGIRAWPSNAAARFLAGIAARDLGDYDRAITELREAVRANNAETQAALELARIFFDRSQYQQAVIFANMALHGRGGAQQPEPYVVAARALTALGQPQLARKSIEPLEERGFASVALRERVILERSVSGPAKAVEVAEKSGLDLTAPEQREVLAQVLEAEVAEKQAASAVARVDRALARAPDDPRLLEMRGVALAAAGRAGEARSAFDDALAKDPGSALATAGLAALRAEAGDVREAVALFDRAYALAPKEGSFGYSSAQLLLASGDSDEAIARLRHVVAHNPAVIGARNDLAWILAERGEELDLALALANEARRPGDSPSILDTLGWVHYKRGEYEQAVKVLEEAVKGAPDAPSMRYRLGLALEKVGDPERAREMFESAVASGNFREAEHARRRLAQLAGS